MFNIKRATSEQLRAKYAKAVKVEQRVGERFYNFQCEIDAELNRRNRAKIYRVACQVLRNRGGNQFAAAKMYADAVIDGYDYFSTDDHHEIGGYYTKTKNPVVVEF